MTAAAAAAAAAGDGGEAVHGAGRVIEL